jgi:hypothetical protein
MIKERVRLTHPNPSREGMKKEHMLIEPLPGGDEERAYSN